MCIVTENDYLFSLFHITFRASMGRTIFHIVFFCFSVPFCSFFFLSPCSILFYFYLLLVAGAIILRNMRVLLEPVDRVTRRSRTIDGNPSGNGKLRVNFGICRKIHDFTRHSPRSYSRAEFMVEFTPPYVEFTPSG